MAEAVLNFVVDRLGLLLVEEGKLLKNVRGEVEHIERKLKRIQAFLKDADARAEAEEGDRNEGVKTWVKQVRDEAYRIEDVIDEYMIQVAQRPHHHGFIGFLHKIAHFIKICKPRHEIASEIQNIMSSLGHIERDSEVYKFFSDSGSSSGTRNVIPHDPREASLYIKEAEVVGIESTRDELNGWLKLEKTPKRLVISLVGMGGLGKTTIAKKVYDNQALNFDCHAWVAVHQTYVKEDLLRTVMKEFCSVTEESVPTGIDLMEGKSLIDELRKYLKKKRYLVVFDDVRKVDFWADIEHALLDNEQGSRIMITTQNKEVAEYCKRSSYIHIHEMQPLSPEMSWELFCTKAFKNDCGGCCPDALKRLSRDIVERCKGQPLAIAVIGDLLSTKRKVVSEWLKVHSGLRTKLGNDPNLKGFSMALSESYHDLPHHLKSCFLYFGLFPKGYSISCMRILRLWIAEGFVKKETGLTLEQVAGDYLTELIHRSLVHVSWVDFDGRARSCRVHDMMHDIILGKTEELGFCQALEEKDSGFIGKPRRISIYKSIPENINDSKIRSLFLLNVDNVPDSFMSSFYANLKLLKVLDFQDAPLNHLPEEVGNLFHLTYLSIRDTKIKVLPDYIGRLRFLETLDLKNSLVDELPMEINNLKNLRHLLAYRIAYTTSTSQSSDCQKGVKIQDGFGCLKALQKLSFVNVNNGVSQIEELRNLSNLRKLGIKNLICENGKDLCASIEKMEFLESLSVSSIRIDEILDLQSMASPPQYLQRLYLKGNLKKLPDWISELQNLIRVRLTWSGLTDDPLSVIQDLPNLLEFGLYEAYGGEQLHFKTGGFQKLEILHLFGLEGLKSIKIDESALPALQALGIGCSLLLKVPTGIEHSRKLKKLLFLDVTLDLVEDAFHNAERMKHIPLVFLKIKGVEEPFESISLHSILQVGITVDEIVARLRFLFSPSIIPFPDVSIV